MLEGGFFCGIFFFFGVKFRLKLKREGTYKGERQRRHKGRAKGVGGGAQGDFAWLVRVMMTCPLLLFSFFNFFKIYY